MYRIWCKTYNEREKDSMFMTPDGKLYQSTKRGLISCSPNTHIVQQCTGLKDKNGVLIYEGDTVKVIDDYEETICNIKWFGDNGYPAFDVDNDKLQMDCGSNFLSYAWINDLTIEIIGNIMEDNNES